MRLDELLQGYREELAEAAAPDLTHLFAEKAGPKRRGVWLAGAGLAAAASLALLFGPRAERTGEVKRPAAFPAALPTGGVGVAKQSLPEPTALRLVPATPSGKRAPGARRGEARTAAAFVALAEMDLLPTPRTYQVVTVTVDETRLVELGLRDSWRARDGRVAAQVLLGEDGIARAVRVLGEERD